MRRIVLLALLLAGTTSAAAQTLELSDCRITAGPGFASIKARCGRMPRPLDPTGEVSGTIELRIAVVEALSLSPAPDPVVPLAGGPGQGAIQFYTSYAWAFEDLRRDRAILLVDQRGTGESARMDCNFDDNLIEGQYSTESTVRYMRECLDELPFDPRFFTTTVAVHDLEAVRKALGYPALNLYGVSYGTRVAQHFARRYPDSTRTITIDGVVPPQRPLGPEIATESQKALDRILARCVEDSACSEHFPDVREDFARIVANLREAPEIVRIQDPIGGRPEDLEFGPNEFAGAIRLLAYHPNSIALIPLLVSEAGDGHFAPLGSQFAMTLHSMMDALALGMHNSVMCTEDIPFYDREEIDYAALEASYMGRMQVDALMTICSVWPNGPIDADFNEPLSTDIPVLLLSGDADPITPPAYAEQAMAAFGNAKHLIGEHQGHGQLTVGCVPRLIADFVASADLASLDTACLSRSFVMPFFVDFAGPTP